MRQFDMAGPSLHSHCRPTRCDHKSSLGAPHARWLTPLLTRNGESPFGRLDVSALAVQVTKAILGPLDAGLD